MQKNKHKAETTHEKFNINELTLNIPNDFTITPGSRYKRESSKSAEEFYESMLRPKFQEALYHNTRLKIILDGSHGYSSSFLDQVFGTLTEEFGDVRSQLLLVSNEDKLLLDEINLYINEHLKTPNLLKNR